MENQRLFCVDVAVGDLSIFGNGAQNSKGAPSSISLLAQFLSFTPLCLKKDLPGNLLDLGDKKEIRLQTGKSALIRFDQRNFIDQLKNGNLILALVGKNESSSCLVLNAQIRLAAVALYFFENDEEAGALKFTSAGLVDMIDEFGRKRAELRVGYRIWQLGASMDEFLSQHEEFGQKNYSTWMPTSLIGYQREESSTDKTVAEKIDIQTEVKRSMVTVANAEIQTDNFISTDKNVGTDKEIIKEKASSASSNSKASVRSSVGIEDDRSTKNSEISQPPKQPKNQLLHEALSTGVTAATVADCLSREAWLEHQRNRDGSIRRLIKELERLARDDVQTERVQNIAKNRYRIEKEVADRRQKAISAYSPNWVSQKTNSFNIYSRPYLDKAPGYGVTRAYLQRLACLPIFHGPAAFPVPRRTPTTKKIYLKDESTACDFGVDETKMDVRNSETQTEFPRPEERRRPSTASRRPRSAISSSDIRRLIQAIGQARQTPEQPKKGKRLLSVGQRSNSTLGLRRQSTVKNVPPLSRRVSRLSVKNQIDESVSSSSVKSEPPSRGPSPFTESVATAIEAPSESSSYFSSVPEKLSRGSSRNSAATAVEQPAASRSQSYGTAEETAQRRSRFSSYDTVSSVRFDDAVRRGNSSRSESQDSGRVTERNQNGKPNLDEEPVPPLSPVSQYLQEFRLRGATRQRELAERQMSIRTESVSSYVPSDLDPRYSSNSSPLMASGATK